MQPSDLGELTFTEFRRYLAMAGKVREMAQEDIRNAVISVLNELFKE